MSDETVKPKLEVVPTTEELDEEEKEFLHCAATFPA
jgi:hypothetical protein